MTQEPIRRHPLPSSRKLAGSVLIALAAAGAVLMLVVLPVEYEIDPTGFGRWIGLVPDDEARIRARTFNPPLVPGAPALIGVPPSP